MEHKPKISYLVRVHGEAPIQYYTLLVRDALYLSEKGRLCAHKKAWRFPTHQEAEDYIKTRKDHDKRSFEVEKWTEY